MNFSKIRFVKTRTRGRLKQRILGWDNSTLNVALRGEYVDYNIGKFEETSGNIFDEIWGLTGGVSYRPSPQTVIRANYGYYWETDLFGNSPAKTSKIQFGISSYF